MYMESVDLGQSRGSVSLKFLNAANLSQMMRFFALSGVAPINLKMDYLLKLYQIKFLGKSLYINNSYVSIQDVEPTNVKYNIDSIRPCNNLVFKNSFSSS